MLNMKAVLDVPLFFHLFFNIFIIICLNNCHHYDNDIGTYMTCRVPDALYSRLQSYKDKDRMKKTSPVEYL